MFMSFTVFPLKNENLILVNEKFYLIMNEIFGCCHLQAEIDYNAFFPQRFMVMIFAFKFVIHGLIL